MGGNSHSIRSAGALLVLAVVAAGCGGASGTPPIASLEATSTSTTDVAAGSGDVTDVEEALLDFAACMRDQGIDMPDPHLDSQGNVRLMEMITAGGLAAAASQDRDHLEAAVKECRHYLEGVALRFASIDRTDLEDRLLAYAQCMREQGFDLPDPDFSGSSGRMGLGGIFPGVGVEVFQDPAFQEANEVCQDIFAGLMPGGDEISGTGPGG
jgi:hypothetical protein